MRVSETTQHARTLDARVWGLEISRIHRKEEGENQLRKDVSRSPHVYQGTLTLPSVHHAHIYTQ